MLQNWKTKKNYGVEPIYRILSEDYSYFETHNALLDAFDELKIMQMLNLNIYKYFPLKQQIKNRVI